MRDISPNVESDFRPRTGQSSSLKGEIPGGSPTIGRTQQLSSNGNSHWNSSARPKKETAPTTFAVEAARNLSSPMKNRTGEQTDHLRMNHASIVRNPPDRDANRFSKRQLAEANKPELIKRLKDGHPKRHAETPKSEKQRVCQTLSLVPKVSAAGVKRPEQNFSSYEC